MGLFRKSFAITTVVVTHDPADVAMLADDAAVALDVHAVLGENVAGHFAEHDDIARVHFGSELSRGTHGQLMALEGNRSIDFAINLQIFGASDVPFNLQTGTETRGAAFSSSSVIVRVTNRGREHVTAPPRGPG